ncbi:RHS repeat-associated core domain-containing protein [Providencia stuartii]|uniref:RHS protein conserved region domain-containing protein n=2 Tax=Providencia stuartii TaxID=588 RepID=A0AAJ1N1V8_PROST|nr:MULTISPECIES: RHS repeat-associated core domain-containing protein [Providencia]MCB5219834.1 hypothetical protein [Providencia stuartii]MDE8749070.1 hypothetical protein [Providencia thailandensis]MDE8768372.1 hypothetical protein [Providencia thailandensis]MDE8772365.1 hypothetical protein [Providencia thailandensis]MDE8788874.1 hypothetical protein [Providencia thailandensis]
MHQHGYRPQEWRYLWNTQNQLIRCFTPSGDVWRYTYDAFGQRLSKTKTVDSEKLNAHPAFPVLKPRVTAWHYLWSGDQMVEEAPVYADGTVAYDAGIQWLYQPEAITPTARYQKGQLHYVVTDHQGTPREIFTEKGIASWAGRLNTWGQMAFWQSHDSRADNDPNYTECHFRFAGQYEDRETGLYYNRFRYYDKDSGQSISPDPIGLLGGLNPYSYVYNPTKYIDPFGLCATSKLGGDSETVDLYRAVGPDELNNIKQTNAFNNPAGIETKYFTTSGEKASEYGKKAVLGFGDEPYTIVKTSVPKNLISDPKFYAEVDGGIPAYVLPSDILAGLKPNVLNHSPLPGK